MACCKEASFRVSYTYLAKRTLFFRRMDEFFVLSPFHALWGRGSQEEPGTRRKFRPPLRRFYLSYSIPGTALYWQFVSFFVTGELFLQLEEICYSFGFSPKSLETVLLFYMSIQLRGNQHVLLTRQGFQLGMRRYHRHVPVKRGGKRSRHERQTLRRPPGIIRRKDRPRGLKQVA